MRPLPAILVAALLPLPGCIIVVDKEVETRYADGEHSSRPTMGVVIERPDAATAAQLNLDREHASVITYIYPRSPAEKAGLRRYDIITAINGDDAVDPAHLRPLVRSHKRADELKVTYLREGKPAEATVVLD